MNANEGCRVLADTPRREPGYKPRLAQGPVMAQVMPGTWMFTNSHLPSGLKHGPANSE